MYCKLYSDVLYDYGKKDEADAIDNALLNYLEIQPSKIRQTLITADKNLALRAKCLGFDFIYFHPNEENSKTKNKNNNKSNSDDIKTIQSKTNQANQTDHADQADKKQDNKKAEIKSHLFLKTSRSFSTVTFSNDEDTIVGS